MQTLDVPVKKNYSIPFHWRVQLITTLAMMLGVKGGYSLIQSTLT